MFRRRRRDGGDGSGQAPGDVDYPAADDELTEQDYDDAGTDLADDYADEDYDELDASDYAEDEEEAAAPAGGEEDEQESAARPRREDLGDPATWTRLRD